MHLAAVFALFRFAEVLVAAFAAVRRSSGSLTSVGRPAAAGCSHSRHTSVYCPGHHRSRAGRLAGPGRRHLTSDPSRPALLRRRIYSRFA